MQEGIKRRHSRAGAKTMKISRYGVMTASLIFATLAAIVLAIFVSAVFTAAAHAAAPDEGSRARITVTPSSGVAPLDVKATLVAESNLLCTSFEIDWGDSSPVQYYDPGVYDKNCYGGQFVREFSHTYATSSTYTLLAKAGPKPLEELNTMSLSIAAYESDQPGNLEDGADESSCFVNPRRGYSPFTTAAYVPLGGELCDGTYEYYVDWGDGYVSEGRLCDNSANHYDTFYHEYATSSVYTATLVREHDSGSAEETCEVSVTDAPQITITKPSWGGHAVIGKPFYLEWKLEHSPSVQNGLDPKIRLTFVNASGVSGFIADVDIDATFYEWFPTDEPCIEGACQSSIAEGDYYIQASVIYDICDGDPYCGKSIPTVASYKTAEMTTVSATGEPIDTWLYTVRDRMFVHPLVSNLSEITYFTAVLNSEASCSGGVYVIEYGDGDSSSMAYPTGKCAAFASSFTHMYQAPGVFNVKLYKNGIETSSLFMTVTSNPTISLNTDNLAAAWVAFTNLLVRLISF